MGALGTLVAMTRDNAPNLTSVGWLAVFIVSTLSLLLLVVAAGWARNVWFFNGGRPRHYEPYSPNSISRGGMIVGFVKHSAPRQDDIEDGDEWERVCVGAVLRVSGDTVYRKVRARIEVYDPNLWRFEEKLFVDGDVRPGEEPECYPIELHINRRTHKLRYMCDNAFRQLKDNQEICVRLIVTSDNFPKDPVEISRAIRHPIDGSERFVLDEDSIN